MMNLNDLKTSFVQKITILHFKGFTGKTEIPINSKLTQIYGKNEKGKTSLLDAFCFFFIGFDSNGERNNILSNGRDSGYIQMDLICNGVEKTIVRHFKKLKDDVETTIVIDSEGVSTSEFNKVFDKNLLITIMNPDYIGKLDNSKIRDMLIKNIPLSKEFLLKEFSKEEIEIINKYFKDNIDLNSIAVSKKSISSKQKAVEGTYNNSKSKSLYYQEFMNIVEKELSEDEPINEEELENLFKDIVSGSTDESEIFDYIQSRDLKLINNGANNKLRKIFEILENTASTCQKLEEEDSEYLKVLETEEDVIKKCRQKYLSKVCKVFNDCSEIINEKMDGDLIIEVTNEEKETFVFKYKNTEYYKLSNAIKIKVGIMISKVLSEINEYYLPIIIDNAETVNEFEKDLMKGLNQIITLAVNRKYDLVYINEEDDFVDITTQLTVQRLRSLDFEYVVIGDLF